jgi:hypothetical protein
MTTQTLTPYQIALLANVNGLDPVGIDWLDSVYRSYQDERVHYDHAESGIQELADSAVPVYSADLWRTFVAVAAWTEDISEFGLITDIEQAARIALYQIAERLLQALEAESAHLE